MCKFLTLISGSLLLSTGMAFAELQPRDNGMVYDTDLNITWIADTHLSRTLGDGNIMHRQRAIEWVEALEYGGFSDWRLPTIANPDPNCSSGRTLGMNCTLSEMGHLFYVELGGSAGSHILQSNDSDVNLFTFNSPGPNPPFWAAFASSEPTGGPRPVFSFSNGRQSERTPRERMRVLAVRDGDVAPAGGSSGNNGKGPGNSGQGNNGNGNNGNNGNGQGNPNTEPGPVPDTGTDSGGSSGGSSTPVPAAPIFAAPTNFRVTNVPNNRMRFNWQDNSNNEDGFVVERRLPMTSSWIVFATIRSPASEYMGSVAKIHTEQGAGVGVCYRMRAFRGSNRTEPSNNDCSG